MAQYELLLPKMGESVAEATVIKWLKQPGDIIVSDDSILEIATDKVDSDVPSPVSGKMLKQLFNENDVVQVGQVIAIIETETTSLANVSEQDNPALAEVKIPTETVEVPGIEVLNPPDSKLSENTSRFYSPLVKSIASQERISSSDLEKIKGSGSEGRVTKEDILQHVESNKAQTPSKTEQKPVNPQPQTPIESKKASPAVSVSGNDEIIEMDRMRKLIADHMVMSKQVSPHVSSFIEVDVTNIVLWRERIKSSFEKRENTKITYTPIFIEAVTRAIKDLPMINVSVSGSQIIKKKNINIGMATALPSGNLIVPVIKNADQLSLVGITKAVNDLATRARANKLQPDEVQDGTFTITNIGSFGNVMGTPIINQPQAAILAVGAIKKKPAVIETEFGDLIGIRHMMFLSMSYDHRVVDGSLGGMFIKKVADYLEAWDIKREI